MRLIQPPVASVAAGDDPCQVPGGSAKGGRAVRPIIMLALAVQAGIFLVAAWTVMFRHDPGPPGRRRVLSGVAISLVIVAAASWNIAERRLGEPGADVLMYGSPLLLGMGLMAVFMLIRRRRGIDAPS